MYIPDDLFRCMKKRLDEQGLEGWKNRSRQVCDYLRKGMELDDEFKTLMRFLKNSVET